MFYFIPPQGYICLNEEKCYSVRKELCLQVWGIYIAFISFFFFFLGGGGIHVTKSSVHVEGAAAVNIVAPILQIKADKEQLIIDILQLT